MEGRTLYHLQQFTARLPEGCNRSGKQVNIGGTCKVFAAVNYIKQEHPTSYSNT